MTVGELAKLLHKDASEVIKKLLFLGVMANINQELDLEAIQLLAPILVLKLKLKLQSKKIISRFSKKQMMRQI